jgi:3-oxoadipate CoA-transferase, beta subunit
MTGLREAPAVEHVNRGPLTRDELAASVARDIPASAYVNLGIGQPTRVASFLDPAKQIVLHTENGMLGMGPEAHGDEVDTDLINAGKIPVTELAGAAYFHHADSFAMMRGGHLDVCVLGAFQVSVNGDLANWHTGEEGAIPAVGGAMDLAIGAKAVYVIMNLFAKDGSPKLVDQCTYPLTGRACVSRVYTEHGVFEIRPDGIVVVASYGMTVDELHSRLGLPLRRGSERFNLRRPIESEAP